VLQYYWTLLRYKGFFAPEDEKTRLDRVREIFATAVRLLPAEGVDSKWRAQWEIVASCAAACWERITAIADHRATLALPAEKTAVYRDAGRALFLSAHPLSESGDVGPEMWISPYGKQPGPLDEIHDSLVYAYALNVTATPGNKVNWSAPREMDNERIGRILTASAILERSRIEDPNLPLSLQAILTWCTFVQGDRLDDASTLSLAAERYMALQPYPIESEVVQARLEQLRLSAAARCFELVGRTANAEAAVTAWTQRFPEDPEGWRRLAQLYGEAGAYREAFEALVRHSALEPVTESDWKTTLLLTAFGQQGIPASVALNAPANIRPTPEFGKRVLWWVWPQYSRLSEKAQEKWWIALANLSVPGIAEAIGPGIRAAAGAAFGEAVALELKACVFDPLIPYVAKRTNWEQLQGRIGPKYEQFVQAFKQGKLTLGQMIQVLKWANEPRNELANTVAPWLREHQGPLVSFVNGATSQRDVDLLVKSRNLSVHGDVDDEQVKLLYQAAVKLFDQLSPAPRG
jgi:tetratricopeptide (TPR) repeat protein